LLVGLVAGILIAYGNQHPVDSPFASAEVQAATQLRKKSTSATRPNDQTTARFWLPLCDQHSPLCAAYISGFVELNTNLVGSVFCPEDWRVAEMETYITNELRDIGKQAPELLDTEMGLLMRAVLESEMPCETKLAQAGRNRG